MLKTCTTHVTETPIKTEQGEDTELPQYLISNWFQLENQLHKNSKKKPFPEPVVHALPIRPGARGIIMIILKLYLHPGDQQKS